jgi:hypothetical protein
VYLDHHTKVDLVVPARGRELVECDPLRGRHAAARGHRKRRL